MFARPSMRDAFPRPSPSTLRAVACLTLSVVALTAAAHGQSPSPTSDVTEATTAARWTDAVDAYASGNHVPASLSVSTIAPDDLLDEGRRQADAWRADGGEQALRRLRAGAALAFELGLVTFSTPGGRSPARYIELGEATLRTLERTTPAAATFGAIWRLGQLQLLLLGGQVSDVDGRARRDDVRHLPPALQAEWHVVRGIGFETASRLSLGTARVQQTPFGTTAMPRQLWVDRNRRSALDHYEGALEVDASHLETRLRLGRLLLEGGQHEQARPHLERAATELCGDTVCGLAWLFLGEWHMLHGTPEAARRAYVRASRVLDVRQSALLGLLRATLEGRPATAIEMTRQFDAQAMLGRQDAPDAWSRYLGGHPFGMMTVVKALRQEAAR